MRPIFRNHYWRFVGYYKYRFEYECVTAPSWHMSYGGDPDQIYTYSASPVSVSFDEATELTCQTANDVEEALSGNHEFVFIWQIPTDGCMT
jgi:hypothetical protein